MKNKSDRNTKIWNINNKNNWKNVMILLFTLYKKVNNMAKYEKY